MIHTSRQLKALVRNMSKSDSAKAQIIIRNYVMRGIIKTNSIMPLILAGMKLCKLSGNYAFLPGSKVCDIPFIIVMKRR